jgi:hypothetical protein
MHNHVHRGTSYRAWYSRDQLSHKLIVGALGALLGFVALYSTAWAAPASQEAAPTTSIWPVLLPLLAGAIVVERLVEVIWNYVDWLLLNTRGWKPVDLKAAQYVQFKSGTSLLMGMVIGILISNYTGMRLFDYLRPLAPNFLEFVPVVWDVIITGIILGSGSKPIHDLLGIITQTKNLLGNSAIRQREEAGAAVADGVLKLAQSDSQAMIDVPGVGPTRIAMAGQSMHPAGYDGEEPAPDSTSVTEQYLQTLRDRTVF